MNVFRFFSGLALGFVLGAGAGVAAEPATGGVAWAELLTSGLPEDAADFYTGVFGWTAETTGRGREARVVLSNRGRPVAGISYRADAETRPVRARWLGFLAVADVDAAAQRAEAGGAVVLVAPRDRPGPGRQAVLADAEGATVGLLAAAPGGESLVWAQPGDWMWPALLAIDPRRQAAFYGALLGCEAKDEARTPLFGGDFLLMSGRRALAGVVAAPGRAGRHAGWLWFVRVADIEATARAVEKRGGRVLRRPGMDLLGGRVAVVADSRGAVMGLVEPTALARPALNVQARPSP